MKFEEIPKNPENFKGADVEYSEISVSEGDITQELEARKIAKKGNFEEIVNELAEKNIFEKQIERVRNSLSKEDIDLSFLSSDEWKIMSAIELFDKNILEHGVNTYNIAKEKVEKVLDGGVVLARLIEKEGVSLHNFYKACLFHDVGKIEIPTFLIHNTLTNNQWAELLFEMVHDDGDEGVRHHLWEDAQITEEDLSNVKNLEKALEKRHLRAIEFVPVKIALSFEEITELTERGFHPDEPLIKIMEAHEKASEKILHKAGLNIEASLAGGHHNYSKEENEKIKMSVSHSSLKISSSLAALIHLADVQEALTKKRPYKEEFSKLHMLAVLAEQSMDGLIDEYVAYLWIKDELKSISDKDKDTDNAKKNMLTINTFVKKNENRN